MSASLTTFLFEAANFAALAGLLGWLFFNPVRDALRRQREESQRQTDEAERKLADAEEARAEIERQRQALGEELRELREQARQAAHHEAEALVREARARVAQERAAWRREAATLEEAEGARLAQALARTTRDLLQRLLTQIDGPQLQQSLLDSACRQLRTCGGTFRDVTIESASPLDERSLQALADALRMDHHAVSLRVDPALLSGVKIHSNRGLVDASVAGLTGYAQQQLATHLTEVAEEPRNHA